MKNKFVSALQQNSLELMIVLGLSGLAYIQNPWLIGLACFAISFLLLRQAVSVIGVRGSDYWPLFACFYVVAPIQYLIASISSLNELFLVFIPVYCSLFIPFLSILKPDSTDYLGRVGKIQWINLFCVFCFSCIPMLSSQNYHKVVYVLVTVFVFNILSQYSKLAFKLLISLFVSLCAYFIMRHAFQVSLNKHDYYLAMAGICFTSFIIVGLLLKIRLFLKLFAKVDRSVSIQLVNLIVMGMLGFIIQYQQGWIAQFWYGLKVSAIGVVCVFAKIVLDQIKQSLYLDEGSWIDPKLISGKSLLNTMETYLFVLPLYYVYSNILV